MHGPEPSQTHPLQGFPQVCYIKNTVTNPNIVVGDYTYYDDPENSEDCGNPAKIIRMRFEADVVERLEAIRWWDWKIETITANLHRIVSADVEALEQVVDG